MVAGDAEEDRAHVTKGGKRSQAILHTSLQPWNGMRDRAAQTQLVARGLLKTLSTHEVAGHE